MVVAICNEFRVRIIIKVGWILVHAAVCLGVPPLVVDADYGVSTDQKKHKAKADPDGYPSTPISTVACFQAPTKRLRGIMEEGENMPQEAGSVMNRLDGEPCRCVGQSHAMKWAMQSLCELRRQSQRRDSTLQSRQLAKNEQEARTRLYGTFSWLAQRVMQLACYTPALLRGGAPLGFRCCLLVAFTLEGCVGATQFGSAAHVYPLPLKPSSQTHARVAMTPDVQTLPALPHASMQYALTAHWPAAPQFAPSFPLLRSVGSALLTVARSRVGVCGVAASAAVGRAATVSWDVACAVETRLGVATCGVTCAVDGWRRVVATDVAALVPSAV